MVSASVSTTPKAARGDAPSDKTKAKTIAKNSKGTSAGSSNSDQNNNTDDGGLSFHVPRKISGGSTSIRQHNLQLLAFVGILALLLQFGSKMGGIIKLPKDGTTYDRRMTSPVKRHHQRQEVRRKAIFDPLVKAVLGKNPDAFWASIVDVNDDLCSLYLAPSSIPETGWGWFAGKNYTAGESIRTERGHKRNSFAAIPPPSASSSASSTTSEMPPTTTTTTTKGIGIGITPWSLLLKPHSVLSNVKWEEEDDDSSSPLRQRALTVLVLVATRDIVEGEEFFLSWEDHPYSNGESDPFGYVIGDSLPSPDHFLRADEHIREARTQYFGTINYTTPENGETTKPKIQRANSDGRWNSRSKKRKPSSQQQLYKVESTREIETGLSLWQRAVEKYDPLVAKLLPTKVKTLVMYHQRAALDESLLSSSSLLGSLRNQTIRSLAKDARCVSSLEWQQQQQQQQPTAAEAESKDDGSNPTTETSKTTTTDTPEACEIEQQVVSCAPSGSHYHQVVTQKRGFAEGEIVGVLPLLVLQQPSYDAQQEPSALSKAGIGACLPISSSSASPMAMKICPLGGIYEHANDLGLANVEYRWSKNSTIDGIPPGAETLQKHSLSLSWDIVALRDLQQNETVVLYQPNDSTPFVNSGEVTEFETDEKTH